MDDAASNSIRILKHRPTSVDEFCRRVRDQLGNVCENCGSTHHIHAHHILPVHSHPKLRTEPDNILVLCRKCHPKEALHARSTPGEGLIGYARLSQSLLNRAADFIEKADPTLRGRAALFRRGPLAIEDYFFDRL